MTKEQTEMHAAVIKLITNLAQRTASHAAQFDRSTGIRAADAIAPLLKALSDLEVIHLTFIPFASPLCTARRRHDCCLPMVKTYLMLWITRALSITWTPHPKTTPNHAARPTHAMGGRQPQVDHRMTQRNFASAHSKQWTTRTHARRRNHSRSPPEASRSKRRHPTFAKSICQHGLGNRQSPGPPGQCITQSVAPETHPARRGRNPHRVCTAETAHESDGMRKALPAHTEF